jgi:hypothetical protein
MRTSVYEGYCYKDKVMSAVEEHNRRITDLRLRERDGIKYYQYEAIADLLLSRLRMVFLPEDNDAVFEPTEPGVTYLYITAPRKKGVVGSTAKLDRTLRDQSWIVAKYNKIKARRPSLR